MTELQLKSSTAIDQVTGEEPLDRTVITIPYVPRVHFRPLHQSKKRWIFIVAHRRAGKTVALVNQLLRAALQNKRTWPIPRYAYIGPSFAQTKDLAWGYVKHYASSIPGVEASESELRLTLPTGATVTLYGGAQAYERMRGLYFDGAVLDEFPLLNPDAWDSVVRPCLADYRGFAIISGTANCDDHFHEKKHHALANPEEWDFFDIKVTDTDALHPDEVAEMRSSMSAANFDREMMNSFEAPVEGAYYAELMNECMALGHVTKVPWDPSAKVITFWDLGLRDTNSIWFVQRIGRELHAIDYHAMTGKGLEWYEKECLHVGERARYDYGTYVMPHDIMVREYTTGRSRINTAWDFGWDVTVAPDMEVKDGIQAVRSMLPLVWWDAERCRNGISAVKSYQQGKNGKPLHNWASHGSDSLRYGAVSLELITGWAAGNILKFGRGPLRRGIKGIY